MLLLSQWSKQSRTSFPTWQLNQKLLPGRPPLCKISLWFHDVGGLDECPVCHIHISLFWSLHHVQAAVAWFWCGFINITAHWHGLCIKYDHCSFSYARDIGAPPKKKKLHGPCELTTPLSKMVSHLQAITCYDQRIYQIWTLLTRNSTHYEDTKGDTKCRKQSG